MERLLKLKPPKSLQPFLSELTEIQAKVATLRWGNDWPVARIARAMGRNRKTVADALTRAKLRVQESHKSRASTKMAAAHKEASDIEDELIGRIDKERQAKKLTR